MSTDKNRQVQIHVGDGSPILTQKYDRNAPCKCGSGKKQKHCCGNQTAFHSTKKIKERNAPDQSSYIDKAINEKYGIDVPENTEGVVTQADASQNT